MATCKNCDRNGLFLSVNKYGLCSTCNNQISTESKLYLQSMNDCLKRSETTTKLLDRVRFCDRGIHIAENLLKYEKLGIPTTTVPPSEIINIFNEKKITYIKEGLREEARLAAEKSKLAVTTNGKITTLSKVILKINEFREDMKDDRDLELLESGLKKEIQEIQFRSYLDDAKKAEFKKDRKKALDKYYEALYFLQHDDIEDALQSESINIIQSKIQELS